MAIAIDEGGKRARSAKPIQYIEIAGGCWICISHTLHRKDGYYSISRKHSSEKLMHRYIYEMFNGLIPRGKVIKHECDNKFCINPDHLVADSQKENVRDAHRRGLRKCKLTPDQVRAVRKSRFKVEDIAARHGLTIREVRDIKKRELYSWVE